MSNNDSDALSGQKRLNTELLEGQRLADSNAAIARSLAREAREDADDLDDENFKLRTQGNLHNRQINSLTAQTSELTRAVKKRNAALRNMKAALRESVFREMAAFLVAGDIVKEQVEKGASGSLKNKDDVNEARMKRVEILKDSPKLSETVEGIADNLVKAAVPDEEVLEDMNASPDDSAIFTDRMKATRNKAEYAYELVRGSIKALEKEGKVSPATMADLKKAMDTNYEMEVLNTPQRRVEPKR